jgi:hypothetical protein
MIEILISLIVAVILIGLIIIVARVAYVTEQAAPGLFFFIASCILVLIFVTSLVYFTLFGRTP